MKSIVVVGSGIAGIYSAILARKKGYHVYLIEQAETLGGLLRSMVYENGDSFDYGTHFIAGTNNPVIDDVILNEKFQKSWNKFPNEKAGNFFADQLTEDCIYVHTQKLPPEEYAKGLSDLINALPDNSSSADLEQQLIKQFGEGFTQTVFKPALSKLFGVDSLSELSLDANLRFGMKRLVLATPEATRELKKAPYLDDKIAYHTFSEGAAARPQYYPKENGAGEWIDYLSDELNQLGVEVLTSSSIDNIKLEDGGTVSAIELKDGRELTLDHLIWTAPLPFLLIGAKIPFKASPPQLRKTMILNYTFDRPPNSECHFFFCYDPNYLPFRVTLYSNLQEEHTKSTGRHRITVEVLTNPNDDTSNHTKLVKEQLVKMGIIDKQSKTLFEDGFVIPNGFPVLNHQYQETTRMLEELADSTFKNVTLAGRGSSKAWFMVDVFNDVHEKMQTL